MPVKHTPALHPETEEEPPVLHLPLRFPSHAATTPFLTAWTTISLPLARLLSSLDPPRQFRAVTGVEVHATCRVRRVWFSEEDMPAEVEGPEDLKRGMPPELALYKAVRDT